MLKTTIIASLFVCATISSQHAFYSFKLKKTNFLFINWLTLTLIEADQNNKPIKNSLPSVWTWYIFNDLFNKIKEEKSDKKKSDKKKSDKEKSKKQFIVSAYVNDTLRETKPLQTEKISTKDTINFKWLPQDRQCKFANRYELKMVKQGWEGDNFNFDVIFFCRRASSITLDDFATKSNILSEKDEMAWMNEKKAKALVSNKSPEIIKENLEDRESEDEKDEEGESEISACILI